MRRLNPDAIERGTRPRAGARAARPQVRRRQPRRWRRMFWLTGAGFAVALLIAAGITWRWRSDLPASLYARATDRFLSASAGIGYRLSKVLIDGRKNTPTEILQMAIGVQVGDPILGIDPNDVKKRLEALGWISSVTVERRLPGVLYIHISEDYPAAIWQHNGSFRLIDREGHLLGDLAGFDLPVVVGAEAPRHTGELLDMLAREPELAQRVRAAVWIGDRRWDVHFDNGVDVKLPAESPQAAWSELARIEREQKLLARDIAVIDMRLPDRLVIRLGPTAVLDRQPGNDT
jgi:cell division protein FtsQ